MSSPDISHPGFSAAAAKANLGERGFKEGTYVEEQKGEVFHSGVVFFFCFKYEALRGLGRIPAR